MPGMMRKHLALEPLEDRRLLAGLTLLTHGFGGSVSGWITEMANAMEAASSTEQARYVVQVTDPGRDGGPLAVTTVATPAIDLAAETVSSPEIMVLLDWSDVAGSFSIGSYVRSTVDVAAAVADALVTPGFLPGLAGPAAELPLHLVGHSRGGSLVGELAMNLSSAGVWVDHVTTLDPHPVDGIRDPFSMDFGDAAMNAWEGVVFWDNYWRTDGDTSLDFTGEPISGTFDVQLSESVLGNFAGYFNEHSDVHLWYHGTIDTTGPIDDGSASVGADAGWYDGSMGPRDAIGYFFSRSIGGTRPAAGLAAGFSEGQGGRVPVDHTNDRWPSLLDLQLESGPAAFLGDELEVQYTWHNHDSGGAVEFFLDTDRNPFNGTGPAIGPALAVPAASIASEVATLATSQLAAGSYELLARISDGSGQRTLYANEAITLSERIQSVTSFEPNSSGFAAEFRFELDPETINLFDTAAGTAGPADVLVVDEAARPVTGSLVLDSSQRRLTFIKSGTPLAAGSYTVTLRSGENSLKADTGELLDGDNDGVAGGDFVTTLEIAEDEVNQVTLSVPDFVRGPGQPVMIPADASTGIPVSMSPAAGIRAIDVVVRFDAALLSISSATADSTLPASASVSWESLGEGAGRLSIVSASDLPSEGGVIAYLQAVVPADEGAANYGRTQIIDLDSVVVIDENQTVSAGRADDALHVVLFAGDVTGNGRVNASDAARIARVASQLDTGFAGSLGTDPSILVEISGNNRVNAFDASLVAQFAALLPVPQIPDVPSLLAAAAPAAEEEEEQEVALVDAFFRGLGFGLGLD